MTYNPATDFVGLWRAISGGVAKVEMPGLDFVVSALGRSGLITVSVSGTAPVANQATTAWFQPATPSYGSEGALKLWNGAAYVAATMPLLLEMLAAAEKAAASSTAISALLDTLATTQNDIAVRGASAWQASTLSALMDTVFGSAQGDVLYRDAAAWQVLAPGTSGQFLKTNGAGANPSWGTIFGSSSIVNSLGGDVALNNTANFFDGPTCAQGTVGTWLASGTVTLTDTAASASYVIKLWDGTTVIASTQYTPNTAIANIIVPISLSGILTNPAGNIRISVKDTINTTGKILANQSGNAKDSTLSVLRIA